MCMYTYIYMYVHISICVLCCLSLQDKVNIQEISGNQDFPEGGFDGLLQSIVCTEVWQYTYCTCLYKCTYVSAGSC